jgi:hypothetical protein
MTNDKGEESGDRCFTEGFEDWRLEIGDWDLEIGIWRLPLGIWDLEFGI